MVPASFPLRHNGRCLDFHQCPILDQGHNLHQGHRRIMPPDQRLVGRPDFLEAGQILTLVSNIPRQAHQMFGFRTALGQHLDDAAQGLFDLPRKVIRLELLLGIPAGHSAAFIPSIHTSVRVARKRASHAITPVIRTVTEDRPTFTTSSAKVTISPKREGAMKSASIRTVGTPFCAATCIEAKDRPTSSLKKFSTTELVISK